MPAFRADPALRAALLDHGGRGVTVLCGAGLSAASGVPTFREAQTGLWARYDPTELATPEAFARDPTLVWQWYAWRRELVSRAAPNAAHVALADYQSRCPAAVLVTQNVDGLQLRAGAQSVIEYHGNLYVNRCASCGNEPSDDDCTPGEPPGCPVCGGLIRPGVVWFGEAIPAAALAGGERAVSDCRVLLSVGTSSLVYPAAGLAEQALRAGAILVEVNPEPTPLSSLADYRFEAGAEQVLPELLAD